MHTMLFELGFMKFIALSNIIAEYIPKEIRSKACIKIVSDILIFQKLFIFTKITMSAPKIQKLFSITRFIESNGDFSIS
jgi:hypothetical protein